MNCNFSLGLPPVETHPKRIRPGVRHSQKIKGGRTTGTNTVRTGTTIELCSCCPFYQAIVGFRTLLVLDLLPWLRRLSNDALANLFDLKHRNGGVYLYVYEKKAMNNIRFSIQRRQYLCVLHSSSGTLLLAVEIFNTTDTYLANAYLLATIDQRNTNRIPSHHKDWFAIVVLP